MVCMSVSVSVRVKIVPKQGQTRTRTLSYDSLCVSPHPGGASFVEHDGSIGRSDGPEHPGKGNGVVASQKQAPSDEGLGLDVGLFRRLADFEMY